MKTRLIITLTALLMQVSISAKVLNYNQVLMTSSIIGDLNNDNKVNVADIVLLIEKLKNSASDAITTISDGTFAREDINQDGYVNKTDLQALVNIVMKGAGSGDSPGTNSEIKVLYEVVTIDLHNFLSSNEGTTIEDIQAQLENYPSITTEVKDDILYLRIGDMYDFICDPYCKTCVLQSDDDIGEIDIEAIQEEINNALYPISMKTRRGTFQDAFTSRALTRVINDRSVLNKGKILLWDPWQMIEKIPRISGLNVTYLQGGNASLDKIEEFSNYDVVFMCCHGTSNGDIEIPDNNQCNVLNRNRKKSL